MSLSAGDTIVEQGRTAPAIYVLVEGAMTIERNELVFATVDYAGAVFGEMSTVMGRAATATVRAGSPSRLHVARDAQAFLQRPGVALAVLRLTANRLETMTQYLTDIKSQFGHLDGHLGMVDGVLESLLHFQVPPARPGSQRDPLG